MNWIQVEAAKADASKDIAILENPETRRLLDDRLVNRFAPMIRAIYLPGSVWKSVVEKG